MIKPTSEPTQISSLSKFVNDVEFLCHKKEKEEKLENSESSISCTSIVYVPISRFSGISNATALPIVVVAIFCELLFNISF